MFTQTMTVSLYDEARNRGHWRKVWSLLAGRSRRLLPLSSISDSGMVRARSYAGLRTVPINQIRGSQGRSHDFDGDFDPLRDHNKERWLNIARARHQDKALPPVELIQVGEVYFVSDGHHRISVARALGQQDIEAEVTVWQVSGSLPWADPPSSDHLNGQETAPQRFYQQVQYVRTRLQEQLLLSLHYVSSAVRTIGVTVAIASLHQRIR